MYNKIQGNSIVANIKKGDITATLYILKLNKSGYFQFGNGRFLKFFLSIQPCYL